VIQSEHSGSAIAAQENESQRFYLRILQGESTMPSFLASQARRGCSPARSQNKYKSLVKAKDAILKRTT